MRRNKHLSTTVTALCMAIPVAANAAGAEGSALEEVVVTSQKKKENLQDVPIAITALSAQDLESKGVSSFSAVLQSSPSVTVQPYPGSSDTFFIYMRGMGQANPAPINSEGSIGVYEDGFVVSRPNLMSFDLADVERIEVLRGPQGTLYGRNTTGGAINIVSKAPTGEFGVKQQLEFGNRDLYRTLTTVNLPRWHDLAAKITVLKSGIDGVVQNIGASNDFGLQKQQGGRVQLNWSPSERFTADYFLQLGKVESTPTYQQSYVNGGLTVFSNGSTIVDGAPNPQPVGTRAYVYPTSTAPVDRTWRPIDLPLSTSRFNSQGLTLSARINDALTIKSLTGYRQLRQDVTADYADFWNFGVPANIVSGTQLTQHQMSQELQFLGALPSAGIDYLAGLYYFTEGGAATSQNATTLYLGGPPYTVAGRKAVTSQQSTSRAVFGQLTWHPSILDSKLGLTFGARYTEDGRRFGLTRVDTTPTITLVPTAKKTFSRFTPSFTANYEWTDELSTYAKVATGYRAGGFYFSGLQPPGSDYSFKPETLTSYEIGLKSYWFDRRARLNVAAFVANYRDIQMAPQIDASTFTSKMFNLGTAQIKGLETELLFTPIRDVRVNINYSYLTAKFTEVRALPCTIYDNDASGACAAAGRPSNPYSPYTAGEDITNLFTMPYVPKHSVDVSADYDFLHVGDGTFTVHADYRWQSDFYSDVPFGPAVPGNQYGLQPSYNVVNARLTYGVDLAHGRATFSVWSKNLFDKRYEISRTALGNSNVATDDGAGGVTPAGYSAFAGGLYSDPRSYGISASYEF